MPDDAAAPAPESPMDVKISHLLPDPSDKLLPPDGTARLQPADHIRDDVLPVLLEQAQGLGQTCSWALSTAEGHDNPELIQCSFEVLVGYLVAVRRLLVLIEASAPATTPTSRDGAGRDQPAKE